MLLGVFYVATLGYSKLCYSDLNDDRIGQHCGQTAVCYGGSCTARKLSDFREPSLSEDTVIVLSRSSEVDYDKYVPHSTEDIRQLTVYFVASAFGTSEDINLRVTTANTIPMEWDGRGYYIMCMARVSFTGFAEIVVHNTATIERNCLFLYALPFDPDYVYKGLIKSSDSRPLYLGVYYPPKVTFDQWYGGIFDIIDVSSSGYPQLYCTFPRLNSTLNGRTFVFPREKQLVLTFTTPTTETLRIVFCKDGIKMLQDNFWVKIKGNEIVFECSEWNVEFTCEDGVASVDYMSYGIGWSANSITLKGDNWPNKFESKWSSYGGHRLEARYRIIIDSNACPFCVAEFEELIVNKAEVYIQSIVTNRYENTVLTSGVGSSVIHCESFYKENSFTLEGITIHANNIRVNCQAWSDEECIDYFIDVMEDENINIHGLTIQSMYGNSQLDLSDIRNIVLDVEIRVDMNLEGILPDGVFENLDKQSIRNDIMAVVDSIHTSAHDMALTLDLGNHVRPIQVASWNEGNLKTIEIGIREETLAIPLAMMYMGEFIVAECTDNSKTFTKDEWEVKYTVENWKKYVVRLFPAFADMCASGETVYGNNLKYRYTRIPDSALDILIYTSDENWSKTFSEFDKYVRILTPNDLNGMEKRLSPNAKNVLLLVTESVGCNIIDLTQIRSDANVFVIGFPIPDLVSFATKDDTLDLVLRAIDGDASVDEIIDFVKENVIPFTGLTLCMNIGQVQTLFFMNINFVGSGLKCTTMIGVMSKFLDTASIVCERAYYDLMTYKSTATQTCKSLTLIPVDVETLSVMFVDKVVFSSSEWELHYSCTGVPDIDMDDLSLCSITDEYIQKISTSKVTEDLTIFSLASNFEFVANGDQTIHGIRLFTRFSEYLMKQVQLTPLLEDQNVGQSGDLVNKLKNMVGRVLSDTTASDHTITFSGSWSNVNTINGPIFIQSNGKDMELINPTKTVVNSLSIDSVNTLKISGSAVDAKLAWPQHPKDSMKWKFPAQSTVEFSEIVFDSDRLTPYFHDLISCSVGSTAVQIKVDTLKCETLMFRTISNAEIKKAITVGTGATLMIWDSVIESSVDVIFEYNLMYMPIGAMLTCPDFTPNSVQINYAGDNVLTRTDKYVKNIIVLRQFSSVSDCNSWKDRATFVEKSHTGNGEVFKTKLECTSSGNLQLTFELTDETVEIAIPQPVPAFVDTKVPNCVPGQPMEEEKEKEDGGKKKEPLIPYGYLATIILLLIVCMFLFGVILGQWYISEIAPSLADNDKNLDLDEPLNQEEKGSAERPSSFGQIFAKLFSVFH